MIGWARICSVGCGYDWFGPDMFGWVAGMIGRAEGMIDLARKCSVGWGYDWVGRI
ncbi:hypothetical protein [Sporosarcina sp. FA15]|uniref:hypothetical protein n=1 Tax=Sporosarcina sp. FA15 TaxID=3413031 RepID=UPI003F65A907